MPKEPQKKGLWTFLGAASAIILLAGVALLSRPAIASDCISDAELDAAIGDQVRAGRFAIDTSMLRDAPMCSGITRARAIQRLVEQGGSPGAPAAEKADKAVGSRSSQDDRPALEHEADDRNATRSFDGLLAFSSPSRCEMAPIFAAFISDLVVFPEDDLGDRPRAGKVTVPATFRPAVGSPQPTYSEDGLTVRVPVHGQWHGVPLVAVEGHYWNGGDPGGFSIILRGSFQNVRAMLNRSGFAIPPSGARTIPGAYEISMSLEAQGGETTFTCL